jgi:hypothetical protein
MGMRLPLRALLVAGVATAVTIGAGLLAAGDSDEPDDPDAGRASAEAPFETTPLASYDTSSATVARGSFCADLDPRQVTAAVDGAPASSSSWQNGDPVEVAGGAEDVGHEFGCAYVGADGATARAWVFAPPVDAEQAQRLAHSAGKAPGCQAADGPAFGSPTLALTCTKDGVAQASYRGLFGDAWLVCEVARPAGATWDVADRAGRWCVGVLGAVGAPA